MPGRAWIGTSGWNYKHWRNLIYPERLPATQWLEFVGAEFDTIEVNTSYYAIPRPASVQSWAQKTPPHLRFALKLWRGITHYRKLKNAGDLTRRFLESAEAMPQNRRGPLLIQLPPNQGLDLDKLIAYVHEFRSLASTAWQLAVEFRRSEWLAPTVYEATSRLDVAICLHDMAGRGETECSNSASFVYVRRHGSGYSGSYSPEQIAADANRIQGWTAEGRDVYVYYNNDIGGHAFFNAKELRVAISSRTS